jgi:two-component system response regulator (stage 0 sporulation protein F)
MTGYQTFHAQQTGAPVACPANLPNRVLVVDDDDVLRLLNTVVLVGSGYQVDSAEDGEEAWQALHAKKYDLLITDNNMPRLTGVELVKKLRSENVDLPVIMVSGEMPTEELNRHPWLHVTATLRKPFSGDELLVTVKGVLHESDNGREQLEHVAHSTLNHRGAADFEPGDMFVPPAASALETNPRASRPGST